MPFQPTRLVAALAVSFALAAPAIAQTTATKVATVNGVAIPKARVDAIVKATGQPEERVRERLVGLEVLTQEANRKGIAKSPEVQQQLEFLRSEAFAQLQRSEVLANALVQDYVRANPITDEAVRAEYERLRAQAGDKQQVPPFDDEIKNRIKQGLQQQSVQRYLADLQAKAKIE